MKTKWIAAALGAALVGGALFVSTPNVLANGRLGTMMGNGNAMAQMMREYGTAVPGGDAEWMTKMRTPEMVEAMNNGTMVEYMNSPEVKEQLKDTPMASMMSAPEMQEFMQSPEMQNLMKSDAFKKMQSSPQFQRMFSQGGASCHGAGGFAPGNTQPNGQPNSGGY